MLSQHLFSKQNSLEPSYIFKVIFNPLGNTGKISNICINNFMVNNSPDIKTLQNYLILISEYTHILVHEHSEIKREHKHAFAK